MDSGLGIAGEEEDRFGIGDGVGLEGVVDMARGAGSGVVD